MVADAGEEPRSFLQWLRTEFAREVVSDFAMAMAAAGVTLVITGVLRAVF